MQQPVNMSHCALDEVVRQCRARVIGWRKVEHYQHGLLVRFALAAFGNDPRATLFMEETPPSGYVPRPDLIDVLVGSFAPEGQRVTTRDFAEVASLRQHGLVTERDDHFEVHFAPRSGPKPFVAAFPTRQAEIDGVVAEACRLINEQRVSPRDILVLYKSHHAYGDALLSKLQAAAGASCRVRPVDNAHWENKNSPVVQDGVMTVSTVASAKGYDAPVVFLLGVDDLGVDTQGRASFYVGATRSKLILYIFGVRQPTPTLLDESLRAAGRL